MNWEAISFPMLPKAEEEFVAVNCLGKESAFPRRESSLLGRQKGGKEASLPFFQTGS